MSRSKQYTSLLEKIDSSKQYTISEAVQLIKETSPVKFDASVELHVRLGIDSKKGDQHVRGMITLPHGTGKTKTVCAFVDPDNEKIAKDAGADIIGGDELIQEIATSGKIQFDEAVATPTMMPKLARIAKILGPKGLMPSPKSDTVSPDVTQMITSIKGGKISFKNDDTANIHMVIGKVSFDADKLAQNLEFALETIKKAKPQTTKGIYIKNISLSSSMGPSLQVENTL